MWARAARDVSELLWVFRYRERLFSTGTFGNVAAPTITQAVVAIIEAEYAPPAPEPSARRSPPRQEALPAKRLAGLLPGELSLPEWVYALQHGRAATATPLPGPCPSCGAPGPSIRVYAKRRHYCARCILMERVCSRCKKAKHLTQFDVLLTGNQRVESACKDCRRAANARRFHQAKGQPRPTISEAWCTWCGRRKPFAEFYKDNRYVDGVLPGCKQCRNERFYEYREGKGATAVEGARQRYLERSGKRRRR